MRLRFTAGALVACRFAISPLNETMSAIRLLANTAGSGYHAPWLGAVGPALETLDLTTLALLAPHRTYGPDFLSPAPANPSTTFATELAAVRATPAARVRREIDRSLFERFGANPPPSARPLLGRGERARELCTSALQAAWQALVEPWWPQIHQTLEADIAYRSRLLADAGLSATLIDLHPRLSWAGHNLDIDIASQRELTVGDEGIALVPTLFGTLGVSHEPPSINYQARGIAALWTSPTVSPEPLRRLLGARRADILVSLDQPASTTGLATRCDLPLSSISEHLTVLRDAGLIATRRTGRRLQHIRTPLGTALMRRGDSGTVE